MQTTTSATETSNEVDNFRRLARMINQTIKINLAGITHEESVIQPKPGGNCVNWVLGHLLSIYSQALPLLGQEPVTDHTTIERYRRGSDPITNPKEARHFWELQSEWDETVKRIDAGLAQLSPDALDRPAPPNAVTEPGDRVRDTLSVLMFHQAYHAGKLGCCGEWRARPGRSSKA